MCLNWRILLGYVWRDKITNSSYSKQDVVINYIQCLLWRSDKVPCNYEKKKLSWQLERIDHCCYTPKWCRMIECIATVESSTYHSVVRVTLPRVWDKLKRMYCFIRFFPLGTGFPVHVCTLFNKWIFWSKRKSVSYLQYKQKLRGSSPQANYCNMCSLFR
jgi:hypothetical protein